MQLCRGGRRLGIRIERGIPRRDQPLAQGKRADRNDPGFHSEHLSTKGEPVGTYSTPWGSKATMVLDKDASVLTWSNTPITSTMKTTSLTTSTSGEKVGSATWVAGKTTVTVPVVLDGRIHRPSTWWRLTHPFQLLGK
jgi:D-alanyl-D-alanine carboxypeptidase (penicillin-binding protein 5/6)